MIEENQSEFIEIGRVLKAVGLDGLCSIELYGNTLVNAELPYEIFLGANPQSSRKCIITFLEQRNKLVVCQFEGVTDRDGAEALRDLGIFINSRFLPELERDEYYHFELKGMEVYSEDGEHLGVVEEVHNYPSSDALDVRMNDRSLVMVPFRDECIIRVERKSRRIIINKEFLSELLQ